MRKALRSAVSSSKRATTKSKKDVAMDATVAIEVDGNSQQTAYDRILNKVRENRKRRGEPDVYNTPDKKNSKTPEKKNKKSKAKTTAVKFPEDNNVMEFEVGEQEDEEFPFASDGEDGQLGTSANSESINNNATRPELPPICEQNFQMERTQIVSAPGSAGAAAAVSRPQLPNTNEAEPGTSTGITDANRQPNLQRTVAVLQNFMVKKGLITNAELQELLESGDIEEIEATFQPINQPANTREIQPPLTPQRDRRSNITPGKDLHSLASSSEVTIYRRAVQELAPEMESKIEKFIGDVRRKNTGDSSRKFSS